MTRGIKDIFVSVSGTGVQAALNIASGIVLARLLGPEMRGELALVILWPSLAAAIGSLSVNDGIIHYAARRDENPSTVLVSGLVVGVVTSLLVLLSGYLVIVPVLYHDVRPEVQTAVLIYFLIIPFQYLAQYCASSLQARFHFKGWVALGLVYPISNLSLMLIIYFGFGASVLNFTLAAVIAGVLAFVTALVVVIRRGWLVARPDLKTVKQILIYSLPLHLAVLLPVVNGRLDQIYLSQMLTETDLGYYVVAFTLVMSLNMFAGALANISFPKISRIEDRKAQIQVIGRYLRLAMVMSAGLSCVVALAASDLLRLLFGEAFVGSANLVHVLALAVVANSSRVILLAGFKAMGESKRLLRVEVTAFALQLVILPLLILQLGLVGVAWAVVAVHWGAFLYALRVGTTLGWNIRALVVPSRDDFDYLSTALRGLVK